MRDSETISRLQRENARLLGALATEQKRFKLADERDTEALVALTAVAAQAIPNRLMTFLRLAHRRRYSDLGYVIHDKGRRIIDIGDGKSGSFGTAVKNAKLPGVTPHTLRHTCGTWLAQKGVPLFQIGGWLDHSDARTTELYAHHHPDFQGEALDAFYRRG
ncbi:MULTISPECIES: tyrosine-type recombinase/integrase [Sphingobium]|jgi:integrase|uniref:tyrosine-type recombinase/integrase n=1 Tax=Sphingobium TaxID=165695 RepID=UPI00242D215A|nr:tyrosine-type recombinase/integrase [Sphingobium yanoikuyae]